MTPPATPANPAPASGGPEGKDAGNGDARGASVIVNAIAVLRSFTADEPMLGVTEIASRVGLHKSTVSRILATFEQEHLVERDPDTRRFRLGMGLIAVAGPLLAELEERRVAYPVLRELTERTGETSALMVWNGTESMCVEQIASRQQVKHTAPLGARYNECPQRLGPDLPGHRTARTRPHPAPRRHHYAPRPRRPLRRGVRAAARGSQQARLGHQLWRDVHRGSGDRGPRLRPPRRHRGLGPHPRTQVPGLPRHPAEPRRGLRRAARQVTQRLGGVAPKQRRSA